MQDDICDHPILSPDAPLTSARCFARSCYMNGQTRTIHHQANAFYIWTGKHYREAKAEEIRSKLYCFLEGARQLKGKRHLGTTDAVD
jgi:hypothetical protein